MYFIVLWFLLFGIFIWINIKLNKWYTKQKAGKITDLQAKMKIHFAICFVHKMKKKNLSGWHLVTKDHVTT